MLEPPIARRRTALQIAALVFVALAAVLVLSPHDASALMTSYLAVALGVAFYFDGIREMPKAPDRREYGLFALDAIMVFLPLILWRIGLDVAVACAAGALLLIASVTAHAWSR